MGNQAQHNHCSDDYQKRRKLTEAPVTKGDMNRHDDETRKGSRKVEGFSSVSSGGDQRRD